MPNRSAQGQAQRACYYGSLLYAYIAGHKRANAKCARVYPMARLSHFVFHGIALISICLLPSFSRMDLGCWVSSATLKPTTSYCFATSIDLSLGLVTIKLATRLFYIVHFVFGMPRRILRPDVWGLADSRLRARSYNPERCTAELQLAGELTWACTLLARKAFRLVLSVPGGATLLLAGVTQPAGREISWPQVCVCVRLRL